MAEPVSRGVKDLTNTLLRTRDLRGNRAYTEDNLDVFSEIFQKMKTNAQIFLDKGYSLKHVDLGGGLGVNYHQDQQILNLQQIKNEIDKSFIDVHYKLSSLTRRIFRTIPSKKI